MSIIWVVLTIGFMGSLGGLVSAVLADELRMPVYDTNARVWRPGLPGTMFIGGVAALLSWALYGPWVNVDLMNLGKSTMPSPSLRVGDVAAALLIGIGGAQWLTSFVDSKVKAAEKVSLLRTREILTKINSELEARDDAGT